MATYAINGIGRIGKYVLKFLLEKNLDEFHMVRVAGLYRLMKQKVSMRTDDGGTTRQQFNDVTKSLRSLLKKQQNK